MPLFLEALNCVILAGLNPFLVRNYSLVSVAENGALGLELDDL